MHANFWLFLSYSFCIATNDCYSDVFHSSIFLFFIQIYRLRKYPEIIKFGDLFYVKGYYHSSSEISFFYFYCLYYAFLCISNDQLKFYGHCRVKARHIIHNSLLYKQGSCHVFVYIVQNTGKCSISSWFFNLQSFWTQKQFLVFVTFNSNLNLEFFSNKNIIYNKEWWALYLPYIDY